MEDSRPSPTAATTAGSETLAVARRRASRRACRDDHLNAVDKGGLRKQDFRYVADLGHLQLPGRTRHSPTTTHERRERHCSSALLDKRLPTCPIKDSCTTGKERRVPRWEHEHV